jgi:hypothetical protein
MTERIPTIATAPMTTPAIPPALSVVCLALLDGVEVVVGELAGSEVLLANEAKVVGAAVDEDKAEVEAFPLLVDEADGGKKSSA